MINYDHTLDCGCKVDKDENLQEQCAAAHALMIDWGNARKQGLYILSHEIQAKYDAHIGRVEHATP